MKKLITAILLAAMLISLVACGGNTGTESSDSDSHTESDDSSGSSAESSVSEEVKYRVLTKADLTDKIRGSWAGQMYGVTWGAPTEFRYCGQIVPEDAVPDMSKLDINHGFNEDDLYVELTYVEEMRKSGYNCSVEQLAKAFAESTYPLDHANKYGRDNVKAGIMPPLSGSPEYNIHADDIDWQINADFVGAIYAGDASAAAQRSFDIGHITNYGDGVYGGVFVSAMHAAAFTATSVREIIDAGIASIPENTTFRKVMDDVVDYYERGESWEQCWQLIQNDYGDAYRCLWYATSPANIDAKLNSAYVLMGLLYGEGDFENSTLISLRCGQDSDCNPSTVAGILGNYYGFNALKKYFSGLDMTGTLFATTSMSFAAAVSLCDRFANEFLTDSGYADGDAYSLPCTPVKAVPYEQWEAMPSAELILTENNGTVTVSLSAYDASGIAATRLEMGDGSVFDDAITMYRYKEPGTYTVSATVTSGEGISRTLTAKVTVTKGYEPPEYKGYGNLAYLGIITCNVGQPKGSGSKDIEIIRDGKITRTNLGQYDTFFYRGDPHEEYIGYIFSEAYSFDKVVFTEGMQFDNGGWFENGILRIEALIDGSWKKLDVVSEPEYPNGNKQSDFGANFETYTFTFEPVKASGIRLIGSAGGSMHFISVAELEVYGSR